MHFVLQKWLEKDFDVRARAKVFCSSKSLKMRLNHLWFFSSIIGKMRELANKKGEGLIMVNCNVFTILKERTCCWNIPWYVTQNCQFKKVCRLYGTIVLQIISFFITICLICSSLVCFGLVGRLSSFVFCSRIVSPKHPLLGLSCSKLMHFAF